MGNSHLWSTNSSFLSNWTHLSICLCLLTNIYKHWPSCYDEYNWTVCKYICRKKRWSFPFWTNLGKFDQNNFWPNLDHFDQNNFLTQIRTFLPISDTFDQIWPFAPDWKFLNWIRQISTRCVFHWLVEEFNAKFLCIKKWHL